MNETFIQYRDQLTQRWNQISKTNKFMIIGIFSMLAVTLVIVAMNLSKTEYATAFTNLQINDAAAIKTYLDSAKVPYEISPDGTTIGVPRKNVAAVKLDVESQGLNRSGSLGYGEFTGSAFGMTENEFGVKYINAVQGEIQQMFRQINGVSSSKVLITIPKSNAFLREQVEESSVAVVLQLLPGYTFDQRQIDTMYSLVAKSVANLKYDNITISNQNGELLPYSQSSGFTQTTSTSQVAQQFQIKKQYEADIQKKVLEHLGGILGRSNVIPLVTATLNFDLKNTERSLVTPVVDDSGLPISRQDISRTFSSEGGETPGGVPGTGATDIPNYPSVNSATGRVNSEEIESIINFEVNRIREAIVSSPFVVKDLAISVGIDERVNLSAANQEAIEKILLSIVTASLADSNQVLTDDQLRSRVTILTQSFATTQSAAEAATTRTNWMIGAGLAALLLIGVLSLVAFRRRKQAEAMEEEAALASPPPPEVPSIDMEHTTAENQIRKQLESLAKKKPEEFVDLLRTWLVDE